MTDAFATGPLCALCEAYADHVGLPRPPGGLRAEVSRRLSLWPFWARAGAGLAALCWRWLAPAALLGRPSRFDALAPEDKEALLGRLQAARSPLLRAAFLMAKTVVLGACYGAGDRP